MTKTKTALTGAFTVAAMALIIFSANGDPIVLTGKTPHIGNFTVGAGGCLTGYVVISGALANATPPMTFAVAPETFPGPGIFWYAYMNPANPAGTINVKVCNSISGYIPSSIYDVTVLTGSSGPGGATGATGTKGATGATGVQGATGTTGATGTKGATGATGVQGATGTTGASGATGATGGTGAQGATGATGATGISGSGAPSVQTANLAGLKSFTTVYQNTGTTVLWVSVSISTGAGQGQYQLQVGPTSAPTPAVSIASSTAINEIVTVFAPVLPNYFYQVLSTGVATGTLQGWFEWH
jgi:hypothetical protein